MEFAGRLDQRRFAPRAALEVVRIDYTGGPTNFVRSAGDRFAIVFAGHLTPSDIAAVVEFYGHSAVLALKDGSRWMVRGIPCHVSFQQTGGISVSYWKVEAQKS